MKRWKRRVKAIKHAVRKKRRGIKRILAKAARKALGGDVIV